MIGLLARALFRTPAPPPKAEELPPDVLLRRSAWLPRVAGWLSGMKGPAGAVTLGRVIVIHPAMPINSRLLRHEMAHVRQWQKNPVTFPLRYIAAHMRHGYTDNPYEVEARNAETRGDV